MTANDNNRQDDSQLISPTAVGEILGLNVRFVLGLPIPRVVLGHRTIRYRKQDVDDFIREVTSTKK